MKKVASILSAATLAIGLMSGLGAIASADCNISNTGNDSVNTCTENKSYVVEAVCVNGVFVDSGNRQDAASGDANARDDTAGGLVTSGNAVNSNGTTVQIGVTGCGTVATTTTTTTTPTTPVAGGKGAGAATPAPAPAALPFTGSNTAEVVAAGSVITLAAGLVASKFGVAAYRRLAVK